MAHPVSLPWPLIPSNYSTVRWEYFGNVNDSVPVFQCRCFSFSAYLRWNKLARLHGGQLYSSARPLLSQLSVYGPKLWQLAMSQVAPQLWVDMTLLRSQASRLWPSATFNYRYTAWPNLVAFPRIIGQPTLCYNTHLNIDHSCPRSCSHTVRSTTIIAILQRCTRFSNGVVGCRHLKPAISHFLIEYSHFRAYLTLPHRYSISTTRTRTAGKYSLSHPFLGLFFVTRTRTLSPS